MSLVIEKAIVIKIVNFGEYDRIISFLTENNGKVACIAKSIRKSKSKLQGQIALLRVMNIAYIEKKNISILKECKALFYFNDIKSQENFYFIHFASELINKTSYEEQPQKELFESVMDIMMFISETNFSEAYYYIIFSIVVIKKLGYALQIESCIKCGKSDFEDENYYIDEKICGIECRKCKKAGSIPININELKLYKIIQDLNINLLKKIEEPKISILKHLRELVDLSIQLHLAINLKSQYYI